MPYDEILASKLKNLREVVRAGFDVAPAQIQGFVIRVLEQNLHYTNEKPLYHRISMECCLNAVKFDGYPALARAGYFLAKLNYQSTDLIQEDKFLSGIELQQERPKERQVELARDSIALLGIADGLQAISFNETKNEVRLKSAKAWIKSLLEQYGGSNIHLNRARLLASDVLENQERFGRNLLQSQNSEEALDLCLWRSWEGILHYVNPPTVENRHEFFKTLLTSKLPGKGELLIAASWLCALDVLVDQYATATIQDTNKAARILHETQGSFQRWRWATNPRRKNVMPSRWLIDNEADVQAFLLAVLYPYFTDQLRNEEYLEGFGLRQGRFDFAITGLGLIVEVKVLRQSADMNKIESEIAEDLALYFKNGNPFENMIVYIYDDSDKPEPENYSKIRNALRSRSNRITDIIIVSRPSMIPNRNDRI